MELGTSTESTSAGPSAMHLAVVSTARAFIKLPSKPPHTLAVTPMFVSLIYCNPTVILIYGCILYVHV